MNDPWSGPDPDAEAGPADGDARRSGRRRAGAASGRGRAGARSGSGFGDGRSGRGAGRRAGSATGADGSTDDGSTAPADDRDPVEVARGICLRALTGASKTRQQLAELLARREVADDVVEAVLDRLTEVGLIDDAAFAAAWVTSRQSGRGLARRALTQELRAKGIDDEVAAAAVAEVDPQDEWDTARRLVERKARSMARLDQVTAERRLVGMLARKGYGGGLAGIVAREALDAVYADAGDTGTDPDDDLPGSDELENVGAAEEIVPGGGGFASRGSGGGGFGNRSSASGGGFGSGGLGGRKASRATTGGKPNGGGLGGGSGIAGQRAAGTADEVGEGRWVPIGRRAEPPR
ncbi:RecX family protein [Modestobacter sp. DSM 44400]|uniref:regulatory protein RecX n=1 Tax=Modestobacter sp. DSM 44400 TaxID=1550230 RepID=UPI00089B9E43|nr:regulatory protein RecX [Modestobacter sp. DSM 44400]SDX76680.1 RecX family protein [Modestobacter sp. DSM 44400]